jgi:hypothetical protein
LYKGKKHKSFTVIVSSFEASCIYFFLLLIIFLL